LTALSTYSVFIFAAGLTAKGANSASSGANEANSVSANDPFGLERRADSGALAFINARSVSLSSILYPMFMVPAGVFKEACLDG